MLSCAQLFETPCTAVCQAPLFMGFPRQEHWSGLPFPSPEDLPNPGIEPRSPPLAVGFFTTVPPGKPLLKGYTIKPERKTPIQYTNTYIWNLERW